MRQLLALAPLLLALVAPSAVAQEGDLQGLVDAELGSASSRTTAELMQRALVLRDAKRFGAEGELDRALERHLERADQLEPSQALFVAAARLLGDDEDLSRVADALALVLESPDEDLALAAAELLGKSGFRKLRQRHDLAERLLELAQDPSRGPRARLAFAKSCWDLGGRQRSKANRVVDEFFFSDDAELRALGALTKASLSGMAIEGPLRRALEELRQLPGDRGRLAAAYLAKEEQKEFFDRKIADHRRAASKDAPSDLDDFVSVMRMIDQLHLEGNKVERDDLVQAAMDGMLRWMDQHSNFLSGETYAKFFQDLEAEYGGIGAYVGLDPDTRIFSIVRPIYSGPAYEAGLKTDDKIVRIDDWPTLNQEVDDIIKRLKGQPGTTATLYVWRHGMDPEWIERPTEEMAVTVERRRIEIPAGASQMLPGKIGLVELDTFSRKALTSLRRDISRMQKDGMRALILDMRRNSGGLLDQAREVSDLFLPPGKIVVTTEDRTGEPEVLKTRSEPLVDKDVPIFVLTSRYTASAAEIVAGALQDHGRATLVGKRTFGKGSVQQLLPVAGAREDRWRDENRNGYWDPWEPLTLDHDGDGEMDYAPRLKLTVAKYLLPSGRSIHRELDKEGNIIGEGGVEPDVVVETPLVERWRYLEERRIVRENQLTDYVNQHWDEHRELFGRLAVNDQRDPELYPEFDALMASLGTKLSRDNVRRLLRSELRRRVQDDRGAEFPNGDFVEDVQVQNAIQLALEALGEDVESIAEFGLVFDFEAPETGADAGRLALVPPPQRDFDRATALIREARNKGTGLTKEEMDEVLQLLGSVEEN